MNDDGGSDNCNNGDNDVHNGNCGGDDGDNGGDDDAGRGRGRGVVAHCDLIPPGACWIAGGDDDTVPSPGIPSRCLPNRRVDEDNDDDNDDVDGNGAGTAAGRLHSRDGRTSTRGIDPAPIAEGESGEDYRDSLSGVGRCNLSVSELLCVLVGQSWDCCATMMSGSGGVMQ